jgi:hypothetical protein
MPRKPTNYQNNSNYIIKCKDLTVKDVYIGRTCDTTNRKAGHKTNCKARTDLLYDFIRKNGGWNNWTFQVLEKYPCENSLLAHEREQHLINVWEATLNIRVRYDPTAYKKEWYFKNKERLREIQVQKRLDKRQIGLDEEEAVRLQRIAYEELKQENDWYLENVRNREKVEKRNV